LGGVYVSYRSDFSLKEANDEANQESLSANFMSWFVKSIALGLGGLFALSMFNSLDRADAAEKNNVGLPTGPINNHRWMGWENPVLDDKDGWNDWDKLLNPNNLPVWFDNFNKIPNTKPKHHWVMVIDTRKCVGCQACVIACKSENNVPLGVFRTVVQVMETGSMESSPNGMVVTDDGNYEPNVKKFMLPRLCNHCDEPPCVEACPVKATFKRQDGIVLVDYEKCIGCGTCIQACPYNMRFFNPVTKTADKCTLCVHRIDAGLEPACVTSCVGRARIFGDLNDPKSEVSRLISQYPTARLKMSQGTEPQVFYIDLNGNLEGNTSMDKVFMEYTYTIGFNTTAYKKLGGEVELPKIEEHKNPFKEFEK